MLTLLDVYGSKGSVEISGLVVRERRFLNVNLGAVNFGFRMGCHGELDREMK